MQARRVELQNLKTRPLLQFSLALPNPYNYINIIYIYIYTYCFKMAPFVFVRRCEVMSVSRAKKHITLCGVARRKCEGRVFLPCCSSG